MKPRTPSEHTQAAEPAASALAGIVGHELNNIAVPLEGFAELALQNVRASESVGPILDEIKIAVARIKSLASELESLGDTGSRVRPVAIGDCMPNESGADPVETEIDWRCSASTVVAADPVHARRALQALISITGRTGSQSASPGHPARTMWSCRRSVPAQCPARRSGNPSVRRAPDARAGAWRWPYSCTARTAQAGTFFWTKTPVR